MVIDYEPFVSKLETIWLAETYLSWVNQPSWILEFGKWNFSKHKWDCHTLLEYLAGVEKQRPVGPIEEHVQKWDFPEDKMDCPTLPNFLGQTR
jgi:hypothetical protein